MSKRLDAETTQVQEKEGKKQIRASQDGEEEGIVYVLRQDTRGSQD